jgi:prostaglandin-E synthase
VAEVELLDAKSPEVKLQPEGRFSFAATIGTNNQKFEVDLELFGAIDVENNTVNKGQRHTVLVLEKAEKEWWSRLLKVEGDQAEASEADNATAGANRGACTRLFR